jgi:hypothetical protein
LSIKSLILATSSLWGEDKSKISLFLCEYFPVVTPIGETL